jgi:hypothetical protein
VKKYSSSLKSCVDLRTSPEVLCVPTHLLNSSRIIQQTTVNHEIFMSVLLSSKYSSLKSCVDLHTSRVDLHTSRVDLHTSRVDLHTPRIIQQRLNVNRETFTSVLFSRMHFRMHEAYENFNYNALTIKFL